MNSFQNICYILVIKIKLLGPKLFKSSVLATINQQRRRLGNVTQRRSDTNRPLKEEILPLAKGNTHPEAGSDSHAWKNIN